MAWQTGFYPNMVAPPTTSQNGWTNTWQNTATVTGPVGPAYWQTATPNYQIAPQQSTLPPNPKPQGGLPSGIGTGMPPGMPLPGPAELAAMEQQLKAMGIQVNLNNVMQKVGQGVPLEAAVMQALQESGGFGKPGAGNDASRSGSMVWKDNGTPHGVVMDTSGKRGMGFFTKVLLTLGTIAAAAVIFKVTGLGGKAPVITAIRYLRDNPVSTFLRTNTASQWLKARIPETLKNGLWSVRNAIKVWLGIGG